MVQVTPFFNVLQPIQIVLTIMLTELAAYFVLPHLSVHFW
jgi:hypothetical protein